jgi:hypothetical protein
MLSREILKNIRRIQLHARFLVKDAMMGEYKSSFKGQGMEFEEVREYSPGDDIRHIDWNVTARAQAPHVKKFREERELTVFLMVDMSASGSFGTAQRFKREVAAEIAAALAYLAIQNNDKVGVILFADGIEKYIVPQKGRNHVLRVIREVLAFEPSGRGTNLAGALQFLMRVAKRKSVVFLISDFLCSHYEKPLSIASRKHDIVAITLYDKMERELPNIGLVRLRDSETGEICVVDSASRNAREQYAALASEFDLALGELLRKARVERVSVQVGESYLTPLVSFFEKRVRAQGTKNLGSALCALLLTSAAVLWSSQAQGQNLEPLKGTTADVFKYSFEVTHAPGELVIPPDVEGTLAASDLRVVSKSEGLPQNRDGKVVRKFQYDIVADLPGVYEVPKMEFKVGSGLQTASAISFDVLSVAAKPQDGSQEKPDILDIRPIVEERWPYRFLIAAGFGALVLFAVILFAMHKLSGRPLWKKKTHLVVEISCHERALAALLELEVPRCDSLGEEERIRVAAEFHFRLGEVFKLYLESRFVPNATDLTSDELWERLRESRGLREIVQADTVQALRVFLQSADLVKFGKASSSEQALREAKSFVLDLVEQVRRKDDEAQRALQKEPWRERGGEAKK